MTSEHPYIAQSYNLFLSTCPRVQLSGISASLRKTCICINDRATSYSRFTPCTDRPSTMSSERRKSGTPLSLALKPATAPPPPRSLSSTPFKSAEGNGVLNAVSMLANNFRLFQEEQGKRHNELLERVVGMEERLDSLASREATGDGEKGVQRPWYCGMWHNRILS